MTVLSGPVLPVLAAGAIFTVMFALGLAITARDLLWVRDRAGLLARGLLSVLVIVPLLAFAVVHVIALPRWLEVGLMLMAISPGAPVALRRSLDAGGHGSFAPALQISAAVLAVVSVPAWIAAFNAYYAGRAWVGPGEVAGQVFLAQLLPLGLGIALRQLDPERALKMERYAGRLGNALLLLVIVLVSIGLVSAAVEAGLRLVVASLAVTLMAIGSGHVLGGPGRDTRTALAVSSAARNPGLALLVATANPAPPPVSTAILAHLLVSALTLVVYVVSRRRRSQP